MRSCQRSEQPAAAAAASGRRRAASLGQPLRTLQPVSGVWDWVWCHETHARSRSTASVMRTAVETTKRVRRDWPKLQELTYLDAGSKSQWRRVRWLRLRADL
jgi:hypothetical protein